MTWLHLWHFGLWGSCLMHLLSHNFSGPCQCHLPHLHSGRWLSSPIPSWGKRIHEWRTLSSFLGGGTNVIFQGMIPISHISSPTIFNCVTASRCYVNSQIRLLFCSFAVPPALVVLQSTDPLLPVPSNVAKPVSTPGFPIISHHASLIYSTKLFPPSTKKSILANSIESTNKIVRQNIFLSWWLRSEKY